MVGQVADANNPLDVVELATAIMARNLEMLRRRSDVYTELDRAEYLLLRSLERTGCMDICGLAKTLGLDPSTVGRQVAAMQRKGLVQRHPDQADRRRSIISPTGEGQRQAAETRQRRHEEMRTVLQDWTEEQLDCLGTMFRRYNRAVAEYYLTEDEPARSAPDPLAVAGPPA